MNARCCPDFFHIRPVAWCAVALWLLHPTDAGARSNIRDAFFQVFPSAIGSRLDNLPSKTTHCGVCHYDFNGSGLRNPWGVAVGNALPGFPNTAAGRSNAIYSIRHQDPDGDGHSTLVEATDTVNFNNTPTFPGLTAGNVNSAMNIPLSEISAWLTPVTGADTTPPAVTVLAPNGGEVWTANRATNITWSATDASGIASVSIWLSLDDGASFQLMAQGLPNSGTFSWVPPNRPSAAARIRIVAVDNVLNSGHDTSDAVFAIVSPAGGRVPTTLRDFDMPGTQPFEGGPALEASTDCAACHGNYDAGMEPHFNWQGSMMAHAGRDLLFLANMTIANQDAPESGDLCLRCHMTRGWLEGRSVPTDGSRMVAADRDGVSCALCHRMVNPLYQPGFSPSADSNILASLSFPGVEFGNGMVVIDPTGTRRGPFSDAASPHPVFTSPFHRSAAFCGSCHDVSNPAFDRDPEGNYHPNAMDSRAPAFSPHTLLPVERTYSEWFYSEYNSSNGVYAPMFAGNKPDGRVSTCQDCHMRDVNGRGCDPAQFPLAPLRADLPLHDLTGGSAWMLSMLTNLHPGEVDVTAIQAGVARATELLGKAATLAVRDSGEGIAVYVTNQCGHKLPTGYPEGRRIWLNVRFYDEATNLVAESAAYDPSTAVLTHDLQAKIYEVHPGMDADLASALGLPSGPSFHFVLNNRVFSDNRIPPRGFTNATFALFGGAPVEYAYADGQYWDRTEYALPAGAVRAEARLYYQSTSKEFVEFLRDENVTDSKGQEMYDLWNEHGKCPPTLMAEAVWVPVFALNQVRFLPDGRLRIEFRSRPGAMYRIEYTDGLGAGAIWHSFVNNGSFVATETISSFEDDFSANTSGGSSTTGNRFYRFAFSVEED